uniref:Uncharacterized protein n=1 Tax=Strombidium rassoulzadegani TaxID=1082188 RepID=A0A7S3FV13_9SPIT
MDQSGRGGIEVSDHSEDICRELIDNFILPDQKAEVVPLVLLVELGLELLSDEPHVLNVERGVRGVREEGLGDFARVEDVDFGGSCLPINLNVPLLVLEVDIFKVVFEELAHVEKYGDAGAMRKVVEEDVGPDRMVVGFAGHHLLPDILELLPAALDGLTQLAVPILAVHLLNPELVPALLVELLLVFEEQLEEA